MPKKLTVGKRRETNWQPMGLAAIENFNTDITTRGFTGHEQIDSVGLIHMNGRVYDAELGRFLSADPNVQALDNLQNFNRYSYVLNNPLSYTDPTGFFFAKLFKAIGKAFGKIFSAIGRAFKKLLRSPIFRAIIQIVACAGPQSAVTCALAAGAMEKAARGSIGDALRAAAFSFIGGEIWGAVGSALEGVQAIGKILVHGVVNGALTVAQGGNFAVGFLTGAVGKIGGLASQALFGKAGTGTFGQMIGCTFMAAASGCAGAVIAGGKCANGAVTAAMAHLFNAEKWLHKRLSKARKLWSKNIYAYLLSPEANMPMAGFYADGMHFALDPYAQTRRTVAIGVLMYPVIIEDGIITHIVASTEKLNPLQRRIYNAMNIEKLGTVDLIEREKGSKGHAEMMLKKTGRTFAAVAIGGRGACATPGHDCRSLLPSMNLRRFSPHVKGRR